MKVGYFIMDELARYSMVAIYSLFDGKVKCEGENEGLKKEIENNEPIVFYNDKIKDYEVYRPSDGQIYLDMLLASPQSGYSYYKVIE